MKTSSKVLIAFGAATVVAILAALAAVASLAG
jgi:hypothetical protein